MGSQHRYLDRETQSSMNKSFSFLLFLHLILHHLSSSSPSALRFPRRIGNKNHYNFAYQVEDSSEGLNYRARESSNGKVVQGEYSVRLPGGREHGRGLKRSVFSHSGGAGGGDSHVRSYSV